MREATYRRGEALSEREAAGSGSLGAASLLSRPRGAYFGSGAAAVEPAADSVLVPTFGSGAAAVDEPAADTVVARSCAGVLAGMDGCEVRLCLPCARVRRCAHCAPVCPVCPVCVPAPPRSVSFYRRSTDGSRYPRLVPSGSRLGLRQHRLRGVQGGRRPPCSGCVVPGDVLRMSPRCPSYYRCRGLALPVRRVVLPRYVACEYVQVSEYALLIARPEFMHEWSPPGGA